MNSITMACNTPGCDAVVEIEYGTPFSIQIQEVWGWGQSPRGMNYCPQHADIAQEYRITITAEARPVVTIPSPCPTCGVTGYVWKLVQASPGTIPYGSLLLNGPGRVYALQCVECPTAVGIVEADDPETLRFLDQLDTRAGDHDGS